jgi:hypothetical protein
VTVSRPTEAEEVNEVMASLQKQQPATWQKKVGEIFSLFRNCVKLAESLTESGMFASPTEKDRVRSFLARFIAAAVHAATVTRGTQRPERL